METQRQETDETSTAPITKRVNAYLSDLFFNYDLTTARMTSGGGEFAGYDNLALLKLAEDVIDGVQGATGVTLDSTPEDLVADFYRRL